MSSAHTTDQVVQIALIRHGESVGNREKRFGGQCDTPLTERGRQQAHKTALYVAESFRPTAIFASDLPRARQTAEPLATATGLQPTWEPALRERTLGVFDGLTFAEAEKRYPEEWSKLIANRHAACPPQAEPVDAVYNRVAGALTNCLDHVRGDTEPRIAIVSHGIAIYHAFAYICGLGSPASGHQVFLLVDNCSVSRFSHQRGRWRIEAVNHDAHLQH